jgi:hypothetical protein
MRTEEDLFNQLAEQRLVCPCGMHCAFFSDESGEYISTDFNLSGLFSHTEYNNFLDCIRRFVVYHALDILYSHYKKNVKLRTLPEGSGKILGEKVEFDTRTLKFYCDNCRLDFFKKFQLAENEAELTALAVKNLSVTCSYLISVRGDRPAILK